MTWEEIENPELLDQNIIQDDQIQVPNMPKMPKLQNQFDLAKKKL